MRKWPIVIAMANEKIAKAKPEEMEALTKAYRRTTVSFPCFCARLEEDRLRSLALNGEVRILKENKRILGAYRATSLWKEAIFPSGLGYREEDEFLSLFSYQGERIVYLDFIFVDPSFQGKGKGKELLFSFFHHYEDSSILLELRQEDDPTFFSLNGFLPIQRNEEKTIYVRPLRKTGICSDPKF